MALNFAAVVLLAFHVVAHYKKAPVIMHTENPSAITGIGYIKGDVMRAFTNTSQTDDYPRGGTAKFHVVLYVNVLVPNTNNPVEEIEYSWKQLDLSPGVFYYQTCSNPLSSLELEYFLVPDSVTN
jgi:hypothetical protein